MRKETETPNKLCKNSICELWDGEHSELFDLVLCEHDRTSKGYKEMVNATYKADLHPSQVKNIIMEGGS